MYQMVNRNELTTTEKQVEEQILDAVKHERRNQDRKWGINWNLTDYAFYAILGEEFGEVGKAINERDLANLKEELIQVAAVAVRHLTALEIKTDTQKRNERRRSL